MEFRTNIQKILLTTTFILFSVFLFSQSCTITSKANDIIPNGLCAPVIVSWEVTYRGVNDAGTPVEIVFDWDDGNVETFAAVNSNPGLFEWSYIASHTYPPGGTQCTYNASATLQVNGVLCTSSIQEQTISVWDTDDANGGEIAIDPEIFPICVGNNGCVNFQDVSLFNCVPPVENDNPNTPTRWTQWIYGTSYTINNVTVGGVVQTYPYSGAIVPLPGPVVGPGPPNNVSLQVCAPNTALVGQFFEVTLRNWNYCNPYDDPFVAGPPIDLVNGDYPPIITTAIILIVPYPDATITPAGPFCLNDPAVNLNAATTGGTWSGTGITNSSTGNFDPSVAGAGIHTITYMVTDANGCTGIGTYDITVYALPVPNILPGPNLEVCPGDALIIDGNPTPGSGTIITHLWTGNTGPLDFTNIQAPTFLTGTQGTYNMTYTVTDDNGCIGTQNATVTVNPVQANILPDPAMACVGFDFNLDGNPTGGTGNYTTHTWTGDISYLDDPNVQTPVFNCSVLGTYNLTYTVIDDHGCTDNDNIIITVYEVPVAEAGPDDSICGPDYDLNATASIGTGTWTQLSGPGTSVFDDENLANSQVSVSIYGVYEFVWTEVFGPGCSDNDIVSVTFFEQPVADAGTDVSLCGLSVNLNASASAGTGTWTQISGTGNTVFSDINSPSSLVTADTYGSYVYQWHENNTGCIDSNTVTINFDVVPDPEFVPVDTSGCSPFNLTFTNTTIGGVNYTWYFGDGTTSNDPDPNHTFLNASSSDVIYTIKLVAESTFGCLDSIEHQLTVNPIPQSMFTSDATPVCSPSTVNFTNTSLGSVLHIWDYGDGSPPDTTDNPTHIFYNYTFLIQYYNVTLTAISSNGCPHTSSQFVTVYPNPDNDFTVDPDTACHPADVQFISSPGGAVYQWNFGDGTVLAGSNIINHSFANTNSQDTTYFVTLITTSSFGCMDTSVKPVVVFPSPVADFSINVNSGCSPLNIEFTNHSTGTDTYYWIFDDGTTSNTSDLSFNHIYNNTGINPVNFFPRLIAQNSFGCIDSTSLTILVYPNINAQFNYDTVGCTDLSIYFDNTSNGAVSYNWDFGDGVLSTDFEPTHIFVNSNSYEVNYNISLVAESLYGCTDTATGNVTVYPVPNADFNFGVSSGCSPFNTTIINNSTGATLNAWNFGDGTTGTQPDSSFNHIFTNIQSVPVNYTVKLVAENLYGCKDSTTNIITVYPEVLANFVSDTSGCHPLPVSFTNQTMGASSYSWNFGDGGSSANISPVHNFQNTTTVIVTYNVMLTAYSSYGCSDNVSHNIIVYPAPIAGFVANPATQVFTDPVSYVNVSNTSSPGTWNYLWNFGDGSTDQNQFPANHGYTHWGVFDISLIVYSAYCTDTAYGSIEITAPEPEASFTGSAKGCAPLEVSFDNTSLYAESYIWDFGDSTVSSGANPTHIYYDAGTYTVQLTATGPGGVDITGGAIIEVYQNPTAYFTAAPSVVFIPDQPVKCVNLSENATLYQWDFGDGGSSIEKNPIHYYTEEGSYNITLVVCTENNCVDSFTIYRAVVAEANGMIQFPNAFTPNQSGPNGGVYTLGSYNNDVFHPIHIGVDEYKLSVYNRWGEMIF
ncbi:MAG: PKD domain-containing protein, partial [Bacteroidota bacterium]